MPLPGHLELHAPLVALTPALLALATVPAVLAVGARRGQRAIGWVGLGAALALQAVFLLPERVIGAYDEPMLGGLVRLGAAQLVAAPLVGAWIAWRFRPGPVVRPIAAPAWCARTALALALPLIAVPAVVLFIEADLRRGAGTLRDHARALIVGCAAVAALIGAPPWAMHALACAVAAATGQGPWRPALAVAALAALAPPYGS